MKKYKVGINKAYFEVQGAETSRTGWRETYYEVVEVSAKSRSEAAKIAWQQNGTRWEAAMPSWTNRLPRKISLDVSGEGVGGLLGRLNSINVK